MRIAIFGPINGKNYFGGVATFDENLAIAFKKICSTNDVYVYSKQAEEPFSDAYGVHFLPVNFLTAFCIKNFDVAIFSLDYAAYLPIIKARKKAYFLHGFFSLVAYSPLKTILAILYQKIFLKYADYIIGNSFFTCFINREVYNIVSDGHVKLGVSYPYLKQLSACDVKKEPYTVLFAGRLVKAKNIDKIVQAMKCLQNLTSRTYLLRIVGDGELKEYLAEYVHKNNLNVEFCGTVDQHEIVKFYKISQIFISLNPTEPFGITFCEALLAGCQIVCPNTGGQVEFLKQYPDSVEMLPDLEPETIAKAIMKLDWTLKPTKIDIKNFTYEETGKNILRIMGETIE